MKCNYCKRELDVEGVIESQDCGGDCLSCMARFGDTDCEEALKAAYYVEWREAGGTIRGEKVSMSLSDFIKYRWGLA